MAALDFPTATTDGQIFKADNGVWYTWVAAGSYWSGSLGTAIGNLEGYYVNKTGDKMFGNLTLGTEGTTSIVLNATSGAATFDGRLTLNGTGAGTAAYIGNNGEVQITYDGTLTAAGTVFSKGRFDSSRTSGTFPVFQGRLNTTVTSEIKADGSITADGDVEVGGKNIVLYADGRAILKDNLNIRNLNGGLNSPTIPDADWAGLTVANNQGVTNVSLYGDGSASFASTVTVTEGNFTTENGGVTANQLNSSYVVFQGKLSGTETSSIKADGSAEFASNVGIGATSPEYKLHAIEPTNDAVALFDSNNINGAHIRFGKSGALKHFIGSASGFGAGDSDDLGYRAFDQHIWLTGSSERMRIDSSGNVGIGVTNPSSYYASGNDLVVGGTGSHGITIKTGTTNQGIFAFAKGISGDSEQYAGYILYNHGSSSAEHMQFAVGATERMRIESSGTVRIGNTSVETNASADELILGTTNGNRGMTIFSGPGDAGAIYFGDTDTTGTGNRAGSVIYQHAGNYMRFSTNGNIERMRIDDSGTIVLPDASPGIQFGSASGSASSTTLNDYEEGTWTPTYVSANATFTYSVSTSGNYVKIGNHVWCRGTLRTQTVNGGTNANAVYIGGLPYTVDNNSFSQESGYSGCYIFSGPPSFAGAFPGGGQTVPDTDTVQLQYKQSADGGYLGIQYIDLTQGSDAGANFIKFNIEYRIK